MSYDINDDACFITDAGEGINLNITISPGVCISIYMSDAAADEMCSIIRNKLNARF